MSKKAVIRAMPRKFPAVAAGAVTVVRGFLDDVIIANAPAKKRRGRPRKVLPNLDEEKRPRGRPTKWNADEKKLLLEYVTRYKHAHHNASDSQALNAYREELAAALGVHRRNRRIPSPKVLQNQLSLARRDFPEKFP